jgi:AcrR family transcriptional regulator
VADIPALPGAATPPAAHSPERADARANRIRLIEAAHEVFRERGLDAEMKEIAERAGVGIGTIYRNFPTKDDLIAAIVGEMIADIQSISDTATRLDDPVEAIRTLLRGGFAITERYGDMAALIHGNMPPGCEQQFEQLDGLRRIGAIGQRGVDAGVFRPGIDPEVVAAHIVSSFVPWFYQELRKTRTLDQIVDAHIDLFLNGLMRNE